MKFTLALFALALKATGTLSSALAAPADAAIVAECGELGVMSIPEGANPEDYRHCAEHPLGKSPKDYWQSLAPANEEFNKRAPTPVEMKGAEIFKRAEQACEYGSALGCSGGYCWRACGNPGDGKWCWTAAGDGNGPWLTCSTYNDCNSGAACGQNCARCGCGC